MKRRVGFAILTFVFLTCGVEAKSDLLSQINDSYYVLTAHDALGFVSTFQHPEILKLAEHLKEGKSTDSGMLAEALEELYFKMKITSDDGFRMFTTSIPEVKNPLVATDISDTIYKTERSLAAIMHTWMQFVLAPVLPSKGSDGEFIQYEITENVLQWRIEQANGGIQTALIVNKADRRVLKIITFIEGAKVVIQPSFESTSDGLLFQGYESQMDKKQIKLSVKIQHQKIKQVYVPQSISLTVQLKGQVIGAESYVFNSEIIPKESKRSS